MLDQISPISLFKWMAQQDASPELSRVLVALTQAGEDISALVATAPLNDLLGTHAQTNIQGEEQQTLDVMSNDIIVEQLLKVRHVSALVSEEIDDVINAPNRDDNASLVVCFDPLDGSSNIATNGTIGSIFSVVEVHGKPSKTKICKYANNIRAAGYILYGPATLLVLSVGHSVAMFALGVSGFRLIKNDIRIPKTTTEFAINMAYRDRWDRHTSAYIENCLVGANGPRGKDCNMRWMGAMVADIHRIFMRGGIFLYPTLATPSGPKAKLRVLYEINPIGWMMEKAGGKAIGTGITTTIHDRAPFIAGSAAEVECYLSHH